MHRFNAPALEAVTSSITDVASVRGQLRLGTSGAYYAFALTSIQGRPWSGTATGVLLLVCGAMVAFRYRREPTLMAIILLPQVAAIVGYAVWTGDLDTYYYMSLMPAAVITILLGATSLLPEPLALAGSIALVIVLLAVAPGRVQVATTMFRMPEYGKLVAGSREIVRRKLPMRSVTTAFPLAPTTDPTFIFRILGGRIDGAAEWRAQIQPDGRVTYVR